MEEYTQITLDEWTQWKEDIRRKLAETANNFVYIGYRLKQIRDSGMFGGAADVFEFAQNEYGLGKSTVSRFIAINEKYSEGGNSLELKEEFKGFSSSKLSEMLTLPDNEIQLITEKTTIRAIRELKRFGSEDPEAVQAEERTEGIVDGPEQTPLDKCLIDFFESRKDMLNDVMKCLESEPPEYKQAAELMVPSGQAFHKKGIVFLFLYEWSEGVKYKLMTETEPVCMDWPSLLNTIYSIYGTCNMTDVWEDFYGKEEQPEVKEAVEDEICQEAAGISEESCDVATDSVNTESTESEEDFSDDAVEDVLTEIEMTPEQEEPLNVEFDTEELMKESDDNAPDCSVEEEYEIEQETAEDVDVAEPEIEETVQVPAEKHTVAERYEETIVQLIEKSAKQAEKISEALHEGRKELGEYSEIRVWVSTLAVYLEQLTKFVDLSTAES